MTGPRQDQFEQTLQIALRRQRNANFVHRFERCGSIESVLGELRALAAPGISSPQRLPEPLWISNSDVWEWDPGPCRWYLWTRPYSRPAWGLYRYGHAWQTYHQTAGGQRLRKRFPHAPQFQVEGIHHSHDLSGGDEHRCDIRLCDPV